ncbi:MAG: hypothetical protein AAF911_02815 [Planctomycetota bacterium]
MLFDDSDSCPQIIGFDNESQELVFDIFPGQISQSYKNGLIDDSELDQVDRIVWSIIKADHFEYAPQWFGNQFSTSDCFVAGVRFVDDSNGNAVQLILPLVSIDNETYLFEKYGDWYLYVDGNYDLFRETTFTYYIEDL